MIVFDQLKKNDPVLRALALVVLAGLLVLLGGLWWVQIISYHRHTENERDQSYRTVRIPAIRGKIMDRNGLVLAENRPSYNVNLYIEELRPQFEDEFRRIRPMRRATTTPPFWKRWLGAKSPKFVPARLTPSQRADLNARARFNVAKRVVDQVGQTLGVEIPFSEADFAKHYSQLRALPMPIIENLDDQLLARFLENSSLPPSVDLEVEPLRYYPNDTAAAHLIGHLEKDVSSKKDEVSSVNYRLTDYRGVLGLERYFDEDLRGKAGVKSVLVNNMGYRESENVWFPTEPGKNLVTTIDLPLQKAAEDALYHRVGPDVAGAIIVMDARNGDLYALASAPSYDPNDFIPGISSAKMAEYNDPARKPLRNRATQENYRPGSVFKIVTALACLQSGVINKTNMDEPFYNPGYFKLGRMKIDDEAPAGDYTFHRAFIKSSNTYFIHYGLEAGFPAIQRAGMEFQFGQAMSLPTRQNTTGNFPTPSWIEEMRLGQGLRWQDGDTANLCIGQGYLDVTPLQIAVMIAAVANGGTIVQPRLVDRIVAQPGAEDDPGPVVFPHEIRGHTDFTQEHLDLIRHTMRADVAVGRPGPDQGTGYRAEVPGMDICAKTGTAENKVNGRVKRKDVWFASFAPLQAPKYVVIVMVEGGVFGGVTAAPVAGDIYRAIQKREQSGDFPANRQMVQR